MPRSDGRLEPPPTPGVTPTIVPVISLVTRVTPAELLPTNTPVDPAEFTPSGLGSILPSFDTVTLLPVRLSAVPPPGGMTPNDPVPVTVTCRLLVASA